MADWVDESVMVEKLKEIKSELERQARICIAAGYSREAACALLTGSYSIPHPELIDFVEVMVDEVYDDAE